MFQFYVSSIYFEWESKFFAYSLFIYLVFKFGFSKFDFLLEKFQTQAKWSNIFITNEKIIKI